MNLCTSTSDIKTADGDESKDILVCDVEMLDGECEWIAGRVIGFVFTSEINVLHVHVLWWSLKEEEEEAYFSVEIPDLIKVEKRGVYPAVQYYSVLRDRWFIIFLLIFLWICETLTFTFTF